MQPVYRQIIAKDNGSQNTFTVRFIVHTSYYNKDNTNEKEVFLVDYKMKYVGGHIEVYDEEGNFLFSADTEAEAMTELRDIKAA